MDTIKLKRATKSVANASTKVLEKDEVLVITPDSGSGKGKCQLKFGDGVTAAKSLPIAIDGENADEMKVSTVPTSSDENPVLTAGETIKVFIGKIKKKFTYLENLVGNVKTVTNLFGSTDAKTVAQGLQILVNTKFNKSDLYDGTDSTSTALGATANSVRKVNEKSDNNATSIRELNSNFYNLGIASQLIPSASNLDTYKTAGTYRCQSASVATSLTNCPVSTAFKLIVDVGNDYLTQKIIVVANTLPIEYRRNYYNSNWGDWQKILTNANIQHGRTSPILLPAGEITLKHYVFPKQFASKPNVLATLFSNSTNPKYGQLTITVSGITTDGFDIKLYNYSDSLFEPAINWIAIL